METTLTPFVHPLCRAERALINREREKSPQREGWVRIEQLSRDTTGKLRISFSNYKKGYYEKLKKEGKV